MPPGVTSSSIVVRRTVAANHGAGRPCSTGISENQPPDGICKASIRSPLRLAAARYAARPVRR